MTRKTAAREETLNEIKIKTGRTIESHRRDLIGLKLDLDILDGRSIDKSSDETTAYEKPTSYKVLSKNDENERREEVIEIVHARMESQGFDFSLPFVANLLITVCQNLVVTLAGKPGSGKTSAASALAKGLGLNDASKHLHIQVQRGWTSDKDILGFENRLTQFYERDRYGLYELLSKLQGVDNEDSFAIVTLDEANLSPLEYYWSSFMGAFDDRSKFYTKGVGLELPPGFRFITTVNNDQTTEVLSDRFLDRSPVIRVESSGTDDYNGSFDKQDHQYEEFSFDQIQQLFNLDSESSFTPSEKRVLQTLRDEHSFLPIEKRKYKAIANFTGVGRHLFQSYSPVNDFTEMKGLDLALLTFLLPKISGQGHKYKENLERTSDFLDKNGLEESSLAINKIMKNSQYESYSFFS